MSREFKSATVNLVEQSRATRTLTANEHEKSRNETLNAIAHAASGHDDALSTEAEHISARIEAASENTRAQITETMDRNQAIMKQQITGLQRGLRQLELEIDRKTEELKEIVLKINNTREGPDRKCLQGMGNSATVVLMSLLELYKALQVRVLEFSETYITLICRRRCQNICSAEPESLLATYLGIKMTVPRS